MLDPFYSAELFREAAAGIPNARLTLYDGKGKPCSEEDFQRELLEILSPDDIPRPTGKATQTP